jgi:hypothetical protein
LFDRCEVETEAIQAWAFLMVPFLLARRVLLRGAKIETAEAILRRGFMPPNGIARLLMHGLKNIETALPFPMPFGTSILAWGRLRIPPDE